MWLGCDNIYTYYYLSNRYNDFDDDDFFLGGRGLGDPYIFLHISSSFVKIRLHTENELPRLSRSALKVPGWVHYGYKVQYTMAIRWVGSYPLLSQAQTPVEVELGCDKFTMSFCCIVFVTIIPNY